jgi:hypothetical protein
MMGQETKLVKQFDQNGDGWLNTAERKAAREFIVQQGRNRGPGGPGGRRGGFGPGRENPTPPQPGRKLTPADVKSLPGAPVYDRQILRTFFLEFENADWEKELADFNNTDVDIPAKLVVDGKTFRDVGVHFRGATSFMMPGEGRKRPLNLSLDFIHPDQNLGGYRTFNLLNSHEDPTYLRSILYYHIAREYLPAPKANYVRLVINGECWGAYISVQQFNKDFVRDWYGTSKGARWKVPGSPGGRGGLNYLGDDIAAYKRTYEIKTKDDPQSWDDLIRLCKVLNDTPMEKLEAALAPMLDIEVALKFFALENVLINNDGFWIRASDYCIYESPDGRFHIIPYDANETFTLPGGPGFGGGPGGPGFGGGPGGPGGFGPATFVAPQMLDQADQNDDQKLAQGEFVALADTWFDKLDPDKSGELTQEQFVAKLTEVLPSPQGFGPPPGGGPPGEAQPAGRGRRGFGPANFLGPGLFTASDANKNGSLTRAELKETFGKWFVEWDTEKRGALNEEQLRKGLSAALPQPSFGGPGGRRGPGFGGGPRVNGVELDPLVSLSDQTKPLLSKLLAVPSLRTRYLGYVRDIAEKWLDWNRLGPLAQEYQAVIAEDIKLDTRKLDSTEAFFKGVTENVATEGGFGGGQRIGLKNFAEQRRTFLLKYQEPQKAASH